MRQTSKTRPTLRTPQKRCVAPIFLICRTLGSILGVVGEGDKKEASSKSFADRLRQISAVHSSRDASKRRRIDDSRRLAPHTNGIRVESGAMRVCRRIYCARPRRVAQNARIFGLWRRRVPQRANGPQTACRCASLSTAPSICPTFSASSPAAIRICRSKSARWPTSR